MPSRLSSPFQVPPPRSLQELRQRLQLIYHRRFGDIAAALHIKMPTDIRHAKGFAGDLIELLLGADAGNLPVPDFTSLGVELKTLPVNEKLMPLQDTYLCHAPLNAVRGADFTQSVLYAKLRHILFVCILSEKSLPLAERYVTGFYLFTPTAEELQIFKDDYDELMEQVALGHSRSISGSSGTYIHMRPKAADSRQLTRSIDENGEVTLVQPKGFYLRRTFTAQLCRRMQQSHLTDRA